jgi:hypothetical protein
MTILHYGMHFTGIYSSELIILLSPLISGIDFLNLVDYVDFFYARTFDYNGLGTSTVQFATEISPHFVNNL